MFVLNSFMSPVRHHHLIMEENIFDHLVTPVISSRDISTVFMLIFHLTNQTAVICASRLLKIMKYENNSCHHMSLLRLDVFLNLWLSWMFL